MATAGVVGMNEVSTVQSGAASDGAPTKWALFWVIAAFLVVFGFHVRVGSFTIPPTARV